MPVVYEKRKQALARAQSVFDVLIVGGGIHGAALAREAAQRGYSVLLLEGRDFGWGTSSRSSKMLHGGVRYLELGDIGLVREALNERANVLFQAPHLCRPQSFLFPVVSGFTKPAWQIGLGLTAYDILARIGSNKRSFENALFPKHERLDDSSDQIRFLNAQGLKLHTAFRYFDGQMDDSRLVIENVLDAAKLGAVTLNYARVESMRENSSDGKERWTVGWKAVERGGPASSFAALNYSAAGESRARYLVNLTGPWLPKLDAMIGGWPGDWPDVALSKGTHLLFRTEWKGEGLILPTGERGRYYFVWPLFSPYGSATLVGTTDKAITPGELDEAHSDSNVDEQDSAELLNYLRRDLPNAALNQETLYGSFRGVRILADNRVNATSSRRTSKLSRSEIFLERTGYLGLLGGKFTTARRTAERVADRIDSHFGRAWSSANREAALNRVLPGAENFATAGIPHLRHQLLQDLAVRDEKLVDVLVARYGSRVRQLTQAPNSTGTLKSLSSELPISVEEMRFLVREEFALTPDDILRRRTGIALQPYYPAGKEILIAAAIEALGQ